MMDRQNRKRWAIDPLRKARKIAITKRNNEIRQKAQLVNPPMKSDLVDVSGEICGETEKAYRFFDGSRTVWLPKSQCEWDADDKTMTMPEWLAKDKELI